MKHLRRILVVAAGAVAVAYSTAIKTPVVTNLLDRHPLAAGYVGLVVAIAVAVYANVIEKNATADASTPAPASSGSTTMGAK